MRETAIAPVGRRDPRGAPELRAQIAAQIAITRGIRCVPDQIILTSGPRNGLCLTLLALQAAGGRALIEDLGRSEEHTSELQSLMRSSYAVFCLKKETYLIGNYYIL